VTNVLHTLEPEPLDVGPLRARVAGDVSVPGDADWDEARLAWNLAVDQRPAAVVQAETADDVAAAVAFAREHGLQVAAQGTGHGASALGSVEDTILIKTHRMRGVSIDPVARIARAEAGVIWMEVTAAAAEHGLAALAGSSPDVGVVGYSLGGGMGWLGRKLGFATNSITAIEAVTADGRRVRANAEDDPDLFWAMRGGGGNFAFVTAIEFALYPIPEVYAGVLFFPLERSAEVLNAWREWVETVPEEVTSVGRIMQFPPFPDVPEPLRGNAFALVEATVIGDEAAGAELLRPLRELGPVLDTFEVRGVETLQQLHMDPEHPVPGLGDGMLLGELTPETVAAVVEVAGPGSGSPLLSVELRHLGGALSTPAPANGALSALDAAFAVFAVGIAGDPEGKAAVERHVDAVLAALRPWDAGTIYFNFTERPAAGRRIYPEHVEHRLRRVKAAYDPSGLIRSNHPIAAAH
jgi:hypothetical protein